MTLITSLLFLFRLILIFYFLIQRNPDFYFWVFFLLFFDPGGLAENFLLSKLIGVLNATDVFFFLMMFCLFIVKSKHSILSKNEDFRKIFNYLIFVGIYYILIYGLIVPYFYDRENFFFFLQKNRLYLMALPIMYMVYFFSELKSELIWHPDLRTFLFPRQARSQTGKTRPSPDTEPDRV